MKRRSQVNIDHDGRQLHYMVELHDTGVVQVTHGTYSYRHVEEGVQFIRFERLVYNYAVGDIHNSIRELNIWTPDDVPGVNLWIPQTIGQRQITLYIPRHSMETFYDKDFGGDGEMQLSGLKYNVSVHTYIAGVKVVLGSYIFDLSAACTSPERVKYKYEEYPLCINLNIPDPYEICFSDKWKNWRAGICDQQPNANATSSVVHINVDPVMEVDNNGYYIRSSEFSGGSTSTVFERPTSTMMHGVLGFNGDATIDLQFNEEYAGDINRYLAETYNIWKHDGNGNIILDPYGNPIPGDVMMIMELVVRDKENIYDIHEYLTTPMVSHIFTKDIIQHDWSWYKEGLIMQGSVEIYNMDGTDHAWSSSTEELRSHLIPVFDLLTNAIPLDQEVYKFLVPTVMVTYPVKKINLDLINMIEYDVSVVNKINKKVINVSRPNDGKSNIIRPVFIATNPINSITIHPLVTENIAINLSQYSSNVDVFFLRVEGVDFMEMGRTKNAVIFTVDGNLLPNATTEGLAYILDGNKELVVPTKYTYEQ